MTELLDFSFEYPKRWEFFEVPRLFLGWQIDTIKLREEKEKPKKERYYSQQFNVNTDLPWMSFVSQTGGVACSHPAFLVLELDPRKKFLQLMSLLNGRYYNSCHWGSIQSLKIINEYADLLKKFGYNCDTSYPYFEEAVYPFDIISQDLHEFTKKPPKFLADMEPDEWIEKRLFIEEPEEDGKLSLRNLWRPRGLCLFVLTENSD